MNKKKSLMLSILAVLTLVLITGGVTYAFFNYTGTGTTDNVITTDTITFLYTEVDGVGNGIKIENAFPMSDEKGKVLSKSNEYFDFKVTSKTASTIAIPYEVTARKSTDSDDIDEYVRVYLTKGETNEEVLLDNYSELTQTEKVEEFKYTEKTIYTGKVPSNQVDYEETFRLRMWIAEDTRFENEVMNDKTFALTVNVYANAKVVTEEDIVLEGNADILSINVNDNELTLEDNEDYDYAAVLPYETTTAYLNIVTMNKYSTVNIEKIDNNTTYETDIVSKKLSYSKNISLNSGDNYFKILVTSENNKVQNQYKVNIFVQPNCDELIGTVYNYDYSGGEEKLRIICDGNYKLETWGAQGGSYSTTYYGGYGGYSVGTTNLDTLSKLYINVGGAGKFVSGTSTTTGGYNGGGPTAAGNNGSYGSGGGATHIALKSGLLSKLNNHTDKILIVSGGGGGAGYFYVSSANYSYSQGGSGGGYIGGSSKSTYKIDTSSFACNATGGTQDTQGKTGGLKKSWSTYCVLSNGGFGKGAGSTSLVGHAGGGAGYYGGGTGAGIGGGGGSGYIKNSLLKDKTMYCYNCSASSAEDTRTVTTTNVSDKATTNYTKKGNGYARITYLGK